MQAITFKILMGKFQNDTDILSKMDPYIVTSYDHQKKQTPTHHEAGTKPTWNCELTFPYTPGSKVMFEAYDEDTVKDDFLGRSDLHNVEQWIKEGVDKKRAVTLKIGERVVGEIMVMVRRK